MNKDSEQEFQDFFKSVKPLRNDKVYQTKKYEKTDNHKAKQRSAVSFTTNPKDNLSLDYAPFVEPDEIISYKKSGVQEGVMKNLRLGKYRVEASLDLHKKTLEQARNEILVFIKKCMKLNIRTVLIIHGKGSKSNPPALLKSFVASWCKQIKPVLCYHSSIMRHGGSGSTYLLLTKNEESKLANKEKHKRN